MIIPRGHGTDLSLPLLGDARYPDRDRLLSCVRGFGPVRRAWVECTGSYGAALARSLRAEAVSAIEVNRGDRSDRRRRGKKSMTGLSNPTLFRHCAKLSATNPRDPAEAPAFTLWLLAHRIIR